MAEAWLAVGHGAGRALLDSLARLVGGEVAENRTVEQVAGEVFLGQFGHRRGVAGIGLELLQLGPKINLSPFSSKP
jgi:hypothetical protein